MIGPQGRNVEVVAHELMHAALHERVGAWRRFMEIPTWFDEGLAMQVDTRPKYGLPAGEAVLGNEVRRWASFSSFFAGDEHTLVSPYAQARALVADWVAGVGAQSVYPLLAKIHDGQSFEETFP